MGSRCLERSNRQRETVFLFWVLAKVFVRLLCSRCCFFVFVLLFVRSPKLFAAFTFFFSSSFCASAAAAAAVSAVSAAVSAVSAAAAAVGQVAVVAFSFPPQSCGTYRNGSSEILRAKRSDCCSQASLVLASIVDRRSLYQRVFT